MSASTPAGKAQEYAPIATEPKAPTMRERQLVLLEQRLQLLRDLGLNTVKAEEVATRTRLPFVPPVAEFAKLRSSRARQNQRAWRASKSFLVQEPGLDAESLSAGDAMSFAERMLAVEAVLKYDAVERCDGTV